MTVPAAPVPAPVIPVTPACLTQTRTAVKSRFRLRKRGKKANQPTNPPPPPLYLLLGATANVELWPLGLSSFTSSLLRNSSPPSHS